MATTIKQISEDTELLSRLEEFPSALKTQVESLHRNAVPNLFNGNWAQSVPSYINTLLGINERIVPYLAVSWSKLDDPSFMPKNLAKRVRGYTAALNQIAPDIDKLAETIREIQDAHEAAVSLPADMDILRESRDQLAQIQKQSLERSTSISVLLKQAESDRETAKNHVIEAERLITQIRELHRVGTSTTLSGAFQVRADALSRTVWWWLGILMLALFAGAYIGNSRIAEIALAMRALEINWQAVWVNVVLTVLSVSAPVWLGWIATKQIIQRFRLSEDYAYKASISNAYEGYRREAVNLDPSFQARLFGSALSRLDELPGRLVESTTHGSPLHEFASSDLARQALSMFPGFIDKISDTAKEIIAKSPATQSPVKKKADAIVTDSNSIQDD
ncbi:hypothetical protein [Methylomonas sp. 11b]|uniref:hypothetical protein n=1 Tax=Methylomonas sp. 11b TaxID=1168169 RepID=UPI00047ACA11|nr:hypothetical protein [Methylomonas sp. 11b]